MMRMDQEVLEDAFGHLRRCGAGRAECVLYLTGPVVAPTLIDGLMHPIHTACPGGYDVPSDAIGEVWHELLIRGRSVRVQVHTHPDVAYHSPTDDSHALIHTAGFLSLVIPNFALGHVGFDGAFLAELNDQGRWTPVPFEGHLELVR